MTALPTRAEYVAGLRELADFVEATEVPLPTYQMGLSGSLATYAAYKADDEASVAQVGRAAQVLGVEMVTRDVGANRHYTADRAFGPIELHFSYVENGAAKSIPGEGGKVADLVEGSGSATAPTEDGAQPAACLEEVGGSGSGQGKAEPPTVPGVWVPIRRRGILHHQISNSGGGFTICGRSAHPNGTRLPLAEAEAFGAVPCPRCYGGAA